jgi:hypothetical protein
LPLVFGAESIGTPNLDMPTGAQGRFGLPMRRMGARSPCHECTAAHCTALRLCGYRLVAGGSADDVA